MLEIAARVLSKFMGADYSESGNATIFRIALAAKPRYNLRLYRIQ
jgi:hypothetical protein